MVDSIPQLVAATQELEQVLSQLEQASVMFSSQVPAIRSQGEAIFLQVRQSPAAVDIACFALSRTGDAFVLFQAFQAILDNLPTLSLHNPTHNINSLFTLRDFLLAVIKARSALERTKVLRTAKSSSSSSSSAQSWSDKRQNSWPNYIKSRANQTFAAVEKRLIGLQVEAEYQGKGVFQEAVQAHMHYVLSDLVGFLSLPDSWPEDEELLLSTQSKITVGFGVMNALLDEIGTTYSRLDSDGNHLGKARSIDFSGLLPLQHRWCKSIVQTYIVPGLLSSVIEMLYSILAEQKQAKEPSFVFPLLVSLCSRLFGWTFVTEKPFAGLEGPVSVEDQMYLLKQDEGAHDTSEDDVNEDSAQIGKPSFRSIPETHLNLVSRNVLSVLHMAYNYAETLERERPGESSFNVTELRKALLDVASCRPIIFQDASRETVMDSKRCQLDGIKSILNQGLIGTQEDEDTRPHNTIYGNSLLFVSQLLHCFLTSSNDKQLLLAAVDVSVLVECLSILTRFVWRFAFEPRGDSDEEDDLIQLGDEAVDNVLSSWRILLPYSHDEIRDDASHLIRTVIFNRVVQPYITMRLENAGSSPEDDPSAQSDVGQEIVPDSEKYQEQLIILASLARDAGIASCLAFLSEGSNSLVQQLQQFYAESRPITAEEEKRIEGIWEQVHWITLIAGHIIADTSSGELAGIPQQIAESSAEGQSAVVHIIQTLGFTLVAIFSTSSNRVQSPRVTETVLWFNARWIPVYLLANTTPLLSAQFNSQPGQEMLQYLLARMQDVIKLWGSDSDVVLQVASVVKSFSISEGVMQILLGLSEFHDTVKAITEGFDVLPAKTHGPLISSIVGCIYTSSAIQSPEVFFEYIKHAIETRLSNVIHQPNFASPQVSQRSDTISSLLNSIDMLDGLAYSIQPKSAAAVYSFISRFFETLVGLVQLYHERSEVVVAIIRVYRTLIASLDLEYSAQPHMVIGLNTTVSALLGKIDQRSLLGDSSEMALEEDVPFEGLCLVIEMLSDLMLASDNDAADPRLWFSPLSSEKTSDVCLQGFSRVTSLLTNDARTVAKVRRRFAKLTSKLWLSYPHRISGIVVTASNEESLALFQACVSAIVISLGFVESILLKDCFTAIQHLSTAVEKVLNMTGSSGVSPAILNVITESMTRILTTVMNGILIEPLATSLLDLHLLSIRSLLQSLANDKMGGISSLQIRMQEYCSKTNLISQYSLQNATPFMEREEEIKKRGDLSNVVIQIATLCLDQNTSNDTIQDRQQEVASFLKEARKVAWEGRAKIRA